MEAANTKADGLLGDGPRRGTAEGPGGGAQGVGGARHRPEGGRGLPRQERRDRQGRRGLDHRTPRPGDKAAEEAAQRALEARKEADAIRAEAVRQAEETRLAATRESEDTLFDHAQWASQQEADLEERIAWRKEQLEREIASLEVRRVNAIGQLNNLRALAEESDQQFADEPTTVITRNEGQ